MPIIPQSTGYSISMAGSRNDRHSTSTAKQETLTFPTSVFAHSLVQIIDSQRSIRATFIDISVIRLGRVAATFPLCKLLFRYGQLVSVYLFTMKSSSF